MENRIEIWKDVIGYKKVIQVSNFGNVRNLIKGTLIISNSGKSPYLGCTLQKKNDKKHKTIHRLVAIAFVKNPRRLKYVNHIDGNKLNNNDYNLEWVSARENTNHYHKTTVKSSKYTGVSWDKNKQKWNASIYFDGRLHCLGYCKTEIMAYNRRCYFEEQNGIINKYL